MKRHLNPFALIGALAGLAQLAAATEIRHAVEVEFETETNKTYQLQGSTNLIHWEDVGEREFGSGRRRHHLASTQTPGNTGHYYYRVVEAPMTNNAALAPWSLAGLSFQMDDDTVTPDRLNFLTETTGSETHGTNIDLFTYLATKIGDNEMRADILHGNGTSNIVSFSFSTTNSGTFVDEEFRKNRLKNRDTGIFHLVTGGAANPMPSVVPAEPPAPPVSLSNMVYYFQTVSSPDRYEFNDNSSGREVQAVVDEGLPTNTFVYTYTVLSSNTAYLQINFGYYGAGGDRYECDLTFTDGQSGHFVRREYKRGKFKDTDTGSFSPYAPQPPVVVTNPPSGGGNTNSTPVLTTNAPPQAVTGESYIFNGGEVPVNVAFQTAATGLQTDDSAPNDFTYTYAKTGPNTASAVITFKADKWDEYDLIFTADTAGTFTRREFRNSVLNDIDTGSFIRTPAP